MEFIRVTLYESIFKNQPLAERGTVENYLLPVSAIKYISQTSTEPGIYFVYILEQYIPKEFDFEVSHAKAKLPKDFIDIIN